MTTYTFQPTTTEQFVDWSDPDVWTGGVVPDGASADVVFPVVTLGNGDGTDYSFVSIASDESYSVDSVSLAQNYLTIDGDLTVATDFAVQAGGEIDMGGGTLDAGTLENAGSDIQGPGQINTTGVLTNNSSIVGDNLTLTLGGLVNAGTLEAGTGNLTVTVPSGFAELSDGTLTGGTYSAANSNTLYLDIGGVVTTDGAIISFDGGGEIDSFDGASSSYVSIESTMNLIAAAGTLALAGQTVDWETPLTVAGTLSLTDQAVLDGAQLTVDAGGVVNGIGTIGGAIANSGVIFAGRATPPLDFETGDGELDIQGAITGDGTIEIAPEQFIMPRDTETATLELGGPNSENVSFADGTGTLQLDDPTAFTGTIRPADSGDQIILAGVSYPSVTGYAYVGNAAGGTLTINAGGATYSLRFAGDFDTASFSLSAGPQLFTTSPPSLLIKPAASEPTAVIQTDGGVTLVQIGGANGAYAMELGEGAETPLTYQGSPVTGGEFGAWTPIGAALLGSGGYEVAWKNAATGLYTVWDTDANGNYVSNPNGGSVSGTSLALEVLELGFDQDLNGDGTIGPPSSVTTIDTVDGTTLLQAGAPPSAEYFIEGSNGFEPVLSNQVPFTGGAYTPIAAAQLASGGYEVAFQDATTGQYTVWDTDANGDYVSDPIGAAAGSSETAEVLETIFDLPDASPPSVTTIWTNGPITLLQVGEEYVIEDGSGVGQWLEYNNSPVTAGQFVDWTPIGAALMSSGGYEVAWENSATGLFTVWDTNANGDYVSNPNGGAVSGTSYALEALEPSFQQGLNGDGTIGPTSTVIDALDGTSLVQLGAVSAEYAMENSGGSGPTLSNQGSAVTSGANGAWTPIAAGELALGGYEVAWRNSATGQYTVWATDANGNYLSDVTGGRAASGSQTADVLAALFELPGAPSLTLIQTDGATSLDEVDGEYVMLGSDGFGPWLDYNNSPVTAGQFPNWTPIGAAQLPAGGYEIAWNNTTTGLYTVWYANADGDYVSSATGGGAVTGYSLGLEVLEWSFNQDLNNDGTIGPPPNLITPIQTDGAITLVNVAGLYVFEVNGAPGQSLDYQMSPVSAGQFPNWTPIGAAQLPSGGFEVAWKNSATGLYTVWDTDANGNYVTNPNGGAVSGSSLALEDLEWSFGQDLNGDGAIGPPSSVPSTVIQTDGSTTLTEFGTTDAEYVMEGSGGTGQALEYQNSPVTAGQFGDWTPIGAAQLEAGGYEVAWKNTGTGLYTVWDTDADGNFVSDSIGSVSGSSFALEDLEPSFQQDLNGDGFLSTQLITTGDTVDLAGQTQPTTINLAENDTAYASGGLNAASLTIDGTADAITLGSGADIAEYDLTPGSGVETIANFSLGQDMLNIDLNGAPPGSLQAYDTSVGGLPAIAFASTADPVHGVVLTGLSSSLTAADLLASHTTFSGGHALIT